MESVKLFTQLSHNATPVMAATSDDESHASYSFTQSESTASPAAPVAPVAAAATEETETETLQERLWKATQRAREDTLVRRYGKRDVVIALECVEDQKEKIIWQLFTSAREGTSVTQAGTFTHHHRPGKNMGHALIEISVRGLESKTPVFDILQGHPDFQGIRMTNMGVNGDDFRGFRLMVRMDWRPKLLAESEGLDPPPEEQQQQQPTAWTNDPILRPCEAEGIQVYRHRTGEDTDTVVAPSAASANEFGDSTRDSWG